MMTKLPLSFFERSDVVQIARELIGKILLTSFNGQRTSGRIVETEAYNGIVDKASHAYSGRRTNRTDIMFREGGTAYVYLCYGIHHLFNVVTNAINIPHAVLIRAIEPLEGVDIMQERLHIQEGAQPAHTLGRGPGKLSKALGISTSHTGTILQDSIAIYDDGYTPAEIIVSARIGVDYAAEDAELPYRFYLAGSKAVSGKK